MVKEDSGQNLHLQDLVTVILNYVTMILKVRMLTS